MKTKSSIAVLGAVVGLVVGVGIVFGLSWLGGFNFDRRGDAALAVGYFSVIVGGCCSFVGYNIFKRQYGRAPR